MTASSQFDVGALKWVRKEIDASLKRARGSLELFIAQGKDSVAVRECVTALHEVHGALQILEIPGAAAVAQEAESLVRALAAGRVKDRDGAMEMLMQAVLQLPSYLERLERGHPDVPLALLPLLNQLRGLSGKPLLTGDQKGGSHLRTREGAGSNEDPKTVARAVRGRYQTALLSVMRDQNLEKNLWTLFDVLERLEQVARDDRAQRIWWYAGAVIEALIDGGLDLNVEVKRLLGRLDRVLKSLIESGEEGQLKQQEQELLEGFKEMAIGSSSHGQKVSEVRSAVVEDSEVDESEMTGARQSLAGVNVQLLETVGSAVREDLARVKDGLDLFVRGDKRSMDGLRQLLEPLRKVTDTLEILGWDVPRAILQEKRAVIEGMIEGKIHPTNHGLMELASALLYVESSLSALAEQEEEIGEYGDKVLRNLKRVHDGLPEEDEPAGHSSLSGSEFRQVINAVVHEAKQDISRAKEAIVSYSADQTDASKLADVPELFAHVAGGLVMLGLSQASEYLNAVRRYITFELIGRRTKPNEDDLDHLADAISAIEYHLEATEEGRLGKDEILALAESSLKELGYPWEDDSFIETTDKDESITSVEDISEEISSLTDASQSIQGGVSQTDMPPELPLADADLGIDLGDHVVEAVVDEVSDNPSTADVTNLTDLMTMESEDEVVALSESDTDVATNSVDLSLQEPDERDESKIGLDDSIGVESDTNMEVKEEYAVSTANVDVDNLTGEEAKLAEDVINDTVPAIEETDSGLDIMDLGPFPDLEDLGELILEPVDEGENNLEQSDAEELSLNLEDSDSEIMLAESDQDSATNIETKENSNANKVVAISEMDAVDVTDVLDSLDLEGFTEDNVEQEITIDATEDVEDNREASVDFGLVEKEVELPGLTESSEFDSLEVATSDVDGIDIHAVDAEINELSLPELDIGKPEAVPSDILLESPVNIFNDETEADKQREEIIDEVEDGQDVEKIPTKDDVSSDSENFNNTEFDFSDLDSLLSVDEPKDLEKYQDESGSSFDFGRIEEQTAEDSKKGQYNPVGTDRFQALSEVALGRSVSVGEEDEIISEKDFNSNELLNMELPPLELEVSEGELKFSDKEPEVIDSMLYEEELSENEQAGDVGLELPELSKGENATSQEILDSVFMEETQTVESSSKPEVFNSSADVEELMTDTEVNQNQDSVLEVDVAVIDAEEEKELPPGTTVDIEEVPLDEIPGLVSSNRPLSENDPVNEGSFNSLDEQLNAIAAELLALDDGAVESVQEGSITSARSFIDSETKQVEEHVGDNELLLNSTEMESATDINIALEEENGTDAGNRKESDEFDVDSLFDHEPALQDEVAIEQALSGDTSDPFMELFNEAGSDSSQFVISEDDEVDTFDLGGLPQDADDGQVTLGDLPIDASNSEQQVDQLPADLPAATEALLNPVSDDIDDEILDIFLEEADEEIASIQQNLAAWRTDSKNAEALSTMRRAFHTLKGSGRLVGARLLGEFAWSHEHLLNQIIEDEIEVTESVYNLVEISQSSILPALVQQLRDGTKPNVDVASQMTKADAISRGVSIPESSSAEQQANLQASISASDRAASHEAIKEESKPEDSWTTEILTSELKVDDSDFALSEDDELETPVVNNDVSIENEQGRLDPVLYDIFSRETTTHVASVREFIDQAEISGARKPTDVLIRALHTMHGSAHMAGVPEIADVAGVTERYVKEVAGKGRSLDGHDIVLLADASEIIDKICNNLNTPGIKLPDVDDLVESFSQRYSALGKSEDIHDPVANAAAQLSEKEESVKARANEEVIDNAADSLGQGSQQTSVSADFDPELLEIFLQEGEEILDQAEGSLERWRKLPSDRSTVAELQRGLHTLKGGARMAGVPPVAELSHALESVFTALVDEQLEPAPSVLDGVQIAFDRLVQLLGDVDKGGQLPGVEREVQDLEVLLGDVPTLSEASFVTSLVEDPLEHDELSSELEAELAGLETVVQDKTESNNDKENDTNSTVSSQNKDPIQADVDESKIAANASPELIRQDVLRVDSSHLGNLINLSGEVSIYRSRLEQQLGSVHFNLGELDQTVARLKEQLRLLEIETEAQMLSRHEREEEAHDPEFDPLEMDRYSQMQELSRALVESVNDVLSLKNLLESNTRETETLLTQQARVNVDLQEGLMRTRMVPFSNFIPRLRRLLRQTARELNRKVELVVEGGEGEIDRTVLERINAPLEHIVRNAVSHGIETPEERVAKGKAEQGTLTLSFTRRGPEVIIQAKDDGAGINVDVIREKAVQRGLIPANADLSDHEIQQFILESGFSTASEVSHIAGRGVGMDVVGSEVKQLGGSVSIESEYGRGTTFTLRLPLTVAVNKALLCEVNEEFYAVPLANLDGVVRLGRNELEKVYEAETPLYTYGGQTYLVQYLGALVGSGLPVLPEKGEALPVILIRAGDRYIGLQVDALSGTRDIVVKSLGPQLSSVSGIAGATILGDGNVVLIIESAALLRMGGLNLIRSRQPVEVDDQESSKQDALTVMVVDDSITMRKVASRVLERNHMQVVTAKDGVEALTQLQEITPDVMLLDIEMPRMDGYELAGHMRRDERWKNVPIIMITSRTGMKHRKRAEELGVNRYLGKPYQENELLMHIHELAGTEPGEGKA